jgi:hypothetical protein
MKFRSTIRVAAILAVLLFLNTALLCAAMVSQVPQPAHPCCPNHHSGSHASVPRCCAITAVPAAPVVAGGPQCAMGMVASLPAHTMERQARYTEAVRAHTLSGGGPLYVQFHQFLI